MVIAVAFGAQHNGTGRDAWLWGAIALSVLLLQLAVVDLEFLNVAFGTVPLEFRQWLLCAAMASVGLWFSELRKLVSRTVARRNRLSEERLRDQDQ